MPPNPQVVTRIRRAITQEIYNAFGLPRQWWGRRVFDPLFWLPTNRFAVRVAQFEEDAGRAGTAEAARNMLRGFVKNVCVWGAENIPAQGPLLLAGNHPGAYDGLAVLTGLRRSDVHIVASGVDFTRSLPVMSQRLIYVTPDAGVRMQAARQCLRHLNSGGALLIYPTGLVDPDPALWSEAAHKTLLNWSHSLTMLLTRVVQTQLVIVTTSHVLSEAAMRSPLIRIVRPEWRQRRLAEYIQVIQQLVLGRRLDLAPRVSFAPAISMREMNSAEIQRTVLEAAGVALTAHLKLPVEACWNTLS